MPDSHTIEKQAYLTARKTLIIWGALMSVTYLAFVLVYPLVPYIYHKGGMLDLELMLHNRPHALVLVYMFGLGLLFFALWRVMHTLHQFSQEFPAAAKDLRGPVLGIGILCGLILLGLYPITALDVAVYVINARNWVLYGGNPLIVPPQAFPANPYMRLAGEYVHNTSPYGPLWETLARIPVQMGITGIAEGFVAMKAISLLAFSGMAILIGWYASQQSKELGVSEVTALAFFALNPLVLLEAVGNGHNDMTMAAFVTLGLVLWQRGKWIWAALALALASVVKLPALIFIPLFTLNLMMDAPTWKERFGRGLGVGAIAIGIFLTSYRLMGPFPDVFSGILQSFGRQGFSPAYMAYVITHEISPELSFLVLPNTRYVFLLIYALIAIALLRRKLTLLEAGFLTYFAMNYLSNAFRIWYPLWFIPFAALNLNSRTFWRTFLFSLAVEFSLLSYYILWRWFLEHWAWGVNGPLAAYWDFYKIMTPSTVLWVFTIPFLGDLVGWFRNKIKFRDELWI